MECVALGRPPGWPGKRCPSGGGSSSSARGGGRADGISASDGGARGSVKEQQQHGRKPRKAKSGMEQMCAQQKADLAAAAEAEGARLRRELNERRVEARDTACLELSAAQDAAATNQYISEYLLEVGTAAQQNLGESLYGVSRGVAPHDPISIYRTIFSRKHRLAAHRAPR